ncbi:ribosomal RNA small subunit methyltransferase A [Patescibacteria group bacterium]|nr:ribosomal RNA small subunit methyltransferase A [Patescibacteria group bacterium]
MGQNFLISKTVLRKIIESSELKPKDTVLEIGPGIGTITKELAKRVKKVICVEKDKRLIEILNEVLKDFKNVEIIQGDILKIKNLKLKIKNYKIVANLPHNIATEVIRKFLGAKNLPKLMVLMVQKEVGKRICSEPPKMERLGVLVQVGANVKILEIVKKDSSWPSPKVDSVILQIKPLIDADEELIDADKNLFSKIVKTGFSYPRKQLINNFSKTLKLPREKIEKWLLGNNIQPTRRAESLSLNDWLNLTKSWNLKLET